MPFVTSGSRRIGRIVAATLGFAFLVTGSASAAEPMIKPLKGAANNPDGCVAQHDVSTPFTAWSDTADYALAPGGDFEAGAGDWTLTKNASLTAGNQPYQIHDTAGASSLELPGGAVATSPPMCIDASYPYFRLFARKLGSGKAGLKVKVLFLDEKSNTKESNSGEVKARLDRLDAHRLAEDRRDVRRELRQRRRPGAVPVHRAEGQHLAHRRPLRRPVRAPLRCPSAPALRSTSGAPARRRIAAEALPAGAPERRAAADRGRASPRRLRSTSGARRRRSLASSLGWNEGGRGWMCWTR